VRAAGWSGEEGGCRLCAGPCGGGVDSLRFGRGAADSAPGLSCHVGSVCHGAVLVDVCFPSEERRRGLPHHL
jgi:hypothetical protein